MDQIKIGKFIASCRKEQGMTQAVLAEKLGISDRAVSKWETGRSMPDSGIMLKLCDLLKTNVNELLSGEHITMENYNAKSEELILNLKTENESYGRKLMRGFLDSYTKDEYCKLAGHGMKLLAEAMEADLPYEIDCPVILICGEKDRAGSAKSYNRSWAKREGHPICRIKDAGHNSNTDKPEEVNRIIREFVSSIKETSL